MKRIVTAYDMMISSPSDTKEEVEAVFESVADFNRNPEFATMIRILRWNQDVFMNSSKSPQESINEQIVKDCDFAIAIFRERLGTKVEDDPSGTAQEIRLFREQNKQVFVFCLKTNSESKSEEEIRLKNYIKTLKKEKVWVKNFLNVADLRNQVLNQLKKFALLKNVPDLARTINLGICTVAVGGAGEEKLGKKIENARHVKIFNTTGSKLFHTYVEQLAKMLRSNGTLQVLLPNPESEFLHDVDLVEGRGRGNPISREFEGTIDNIRKILVEANRVPCDTMGKIWIGCARTLLRQTEIICIGDKNIENTDDEQIWCWVTVTMPPKRASGKSLSLECQTIEEKDDLAEWTNTNFDRCWEESNIIIEFDGTQDIPYFYMEKPHAIDFWKNLTDTAKDSIDEARRDPERNGVLIEVAAQHPLNSDGTPGEEFSRRLDMGIELYYRIKKEDKRCKIYVPGSLHMFKGIEDRLTLSEAGKEYLMRKGIPSEDIYGNSENDRYRPGDGVYNSADECYVASKIWKNERFSELYCAFAHQCNVCGKRHIT